MLAGLFLIQALNEGTTIRGHVVDQDLSSGLAHASISSPSLPRPVFTDDSGAFTLSVDGTQPVRLEIRRIGYAPRDTVLSPDATEVTIALRRTAVRIDAVVVREHPACATNRPDTARGPDPVLLRALEQLQINARQFEVVAAHYPFVSTLEVSRARSDAGRVRIVAHDTVRVPSRSTWSYRPGRVVTGYRNRVFNIPLLSDLGGDAFIAAHCFSIGAVDSSADRPAYRIDFTTATDVRTPDVDGSIYLDTQSWQIRRSIVRLTHPDVIDVTSYEVVTDFGEAMEAIPDVQHIFATQVLRTRRPATLAVYEEWRLIDTRFVRGRPGGPQ